MIFGNFAAIGDALQVSARVVDVESGLVLKSATAHGDLTSARALGNELSQRLARDLGITVTRAAQTAGVAGERALEIDPNDREALRRLKKLLGASH
jgi:hypothetical protein